MTTQTDSFIEQAIPKINAVLIERPEGFPDESGVGQGTLGAMAVGADLESATKVNIQLHLDPDYREKFGGSEYLAGAVLFLEQKAEISDSSESLSQETKRYNRELLDVACGYVFDYMGYKVEPLNVDHNERVGNPTIIHEMYTTLHERLVSREKPLTEETISMVGFRTVKEVLNRYGFKSLQDLEDYDSVEDFKAIFGDVNG